MCCLLEVDDKNKLTFSKVLVITEHDLFFFLKSLILLISLNRGLVCLIDKVSTKQNTQTDPDY